MVYKVIMQIYGDKWDGVQLCGAFGTNRIIFDRIHFDQDRLWHNCMSSTWSWLKGYKKDFSVTFQMWQTNPAICLSYL